ncbi:Multidrug export protein EmrB [Halomonadaceae bacterium LMG 33818]|uniref:DHA2 family efflux MFS transporter permease subunit n=1 Tax=Cernens ardua TaxID=3402176 RepID=UPI003EDC8648
MAAAQQSPQPPLKGLALIALTIGVSFATFMEVLDISIVNVSVRTISGDLGVSYDQGTMAITAYSLGSAIVQPLTGWISRRVGEVKTFTISVMLFAFLSMMCGLSTNLNMLIICRLLQGVVSGPMVPLSQTLMMTNYPPEKRPIALAIWAMTVVVAPIFGPVLGGYISDNFQWSWIFFINIPVGIITAIIAMVVLRGRETKTVKLPIDVVGLGLLAVGVGSLQFLLDKGNDYDWFSSHLILVLAIISTVCLTFLIAWELMHENPIVDLKLFKNRNFAVGVTCLCTGMFCFFGGTVVLPTWLQQTEGYDATWSGLAVAPIGILAMIFSPIVGANIRRFDMRILISLGLATFAVCNFWMASSRDGMEYIRIAEPRFFMGIGIALFFVPINQLLLAGFRDDQVAAASGISNFCRTIAGSISTAISTTLYSHRTIFHHATLVENVRAGSPATEQYLNALQAAGVPQSSRYAEMNNVVNVQASTLALNDIFWLFGVLFCFCVIVVWFSKPNATT